MSDIVKQLLLQLVLIALNAFFAATEIAVISLNEKKVKALAEDGDKKAARMLKMIEEPTGFLSTIQIGITLAGFLGSAFAADNFAERLSDFAVTTFHIPEAQAGLIDTAAVIVITLILSFFTLVLGELVPKRVAMKYKEGLANAVCGVISALAVVLRPIVWLLTVSTNGVIRLFGIDPDADDEAVSEEDIVLMLDAGAEDGTLSEDDIAYIKNVFKLDRLIAADVMTPRNLVEMVSADWKETEILKVIEECGYSRIPVYKETLDNVVGILHTRDYLLKHSRPEFKLEDAMMQPSFVPETVHLDILFKEMQKDHTHMVVVVNEYGETAGIVTMEDILEEIVGEIWDEQDEAVINIQEVAENKYKVLSSTPIDEFFEFFDLKEEEEIDSSTVNGWVIECSGVIPGVGHTMQYKNLAIKIIKADGLRTEEILVEVKPETEEAE